MFICYFWGKNIYIYKFTIKHNWYNDVNLKNHHFGSSSHTTTLKIVVEDNRKYAEEQLLEKLTNVHMCTTEKELNNLISHLNLTLKRYIIWH